MTSLIFKLIIYTKHHFNVTLQRCASHLTKGNIKFCYFVLIHLLNVIKPLPQTDLGVLVQLKLGKRPISTFFLLQKITLEALVPSWLVHNYSPPLPESASEASVRILRSPVIFDRLSASFCLAFVGLYFT